MNTVARRIRTSPTMDIRRAQVSLMATGRMAVRHTNEAQNAGQPYSGNGNKKKPHKNTWPKKVAGVCACAVLFGAVAGVTFQGVSRIGGSKTTETTASTATADHTFRSSADRE